MRHLVSLTGFVFCIACVSTQNEDGGSGGAGNAGNAAGAGNTGNTGNVGGAAGSGGTGATGGGSGQSGGTCMDILACIAECPDGDTSCPDTCYAAGSSTGQAQLMALLTCMDQNQCADVACIETLCNSELVTCLSTSTAGGGTPNPGGTVPGGSIPPELVGHWVDPGSTEVADFTFGADGSAQHTKYKESWVGSCSMSVNSEWSTGSAVASGDQLTVTLADGVTSVAWVGGCGTGYTNTAPGKVLQFQYSLDLSGPKPGLWLTDLSCTGEYCQDYYEKN